MPAVSIGSLPLYVNDPTGVTLLIRDPSNRTTLRITREQLLTGLGPGGGVTSFNTRTGIVTLQASDISSLGIGIVSSSTFSSPSQGTLTTNINGVSQNIDLGLQTGDSVQFAQVTATLIGNASTATTAATASSADTFVVRQNLTGSNALFTGTITAQSLVVQTVTSSVSFITGSTKFGSQSTNTHQFTGSVTVTGSFAVTGRATITNLTGSLFGSASYALTASHVPDGIIGTGSANYLAKFNGNRSVTSSLLYDNGAAIGLGTILPEGALDVSYGSGGGDGGALSLGADYGLYTRTNNTRKYALVTAVPYTNVRFNTALLAHDSDGTDNILHVGGTGDVGVNSPTSIRFYTTSSAATDGTGVVRMVIDGTGRVGIGRGFSTPASILHASSSTPTVATFEHTTAPRIVLKSNTNDAYLSYSGSIALGYSATHTSNILFVTNSGIFIPTTENEANSNVLLFNSSTGKVTYISTASLQGLTGSGATNYIPVFTNSRTISSSILYDNGSAVGLKTTLPKGAFDISYGSGGGDGGALSLGADYTGDLYTRTNNTRKYALVTAVPYVNTRFNTALLAHDSDGTDNILHIGGTGAVGVNSPTSIRFYTTSSTTDNIGTLRMIIDGSGRVGIGRGSGTPASVLHVSSSTPTVATFEHSTAPRIVLKSSANDAYLSYTGSIAIGYSATHTDNILFITSSGITVSGSQISFVDLPSATKTEIVYFDTATKKLSYGPGGTISGIDGYITRFSGSSTISSSVMFESASNIGIGTTSPSVRLHISGSSSTSTVQRLQRGIQGSDSGMSTIFGDPYIQVGGGEFYANGVQTIGFGYTNGTSRQPVEIGYQATDVSTFTRGDLVFATRATLTNVAPSEKMRITSNGQIVFANYTGPSAFPGSAAATLGVDVNGNVITTSGGAVTGTGAANYIALFNGASSLATSSIYQDSNQIGIGLTAPTSVLHVSSAAATVSTFEHATALRMRLKAGANSSYLSYDGTSLGLGFSTTHANNVLFISSSNVGIGNTSSLHKLQITQAVDGNYPTLGTGKGALFIAGDTNLYGLYTGINTTDGNAWFQAMRNNSATAYNIVLQSAGGNVGIGATSPSYKLHIADATAPIIQLEETSVGNAFLGVDANQFFIRRTIAGVDSININSSNNVGIGAASAGGYKLYVSGSVNTLNSYYSNGVELITSDGSNNYLKTGASLYIQQGVTTRAFIDGSGNVGIGTTSPASVLDVNGTISLSRANFARLSGNYIQLYTSGSTNIGLYLGGAGDPGNYYDNTNHYFRDIGGSSTYMHITNAANVGINKTNPSEKLDVNGNAIITGSLTLSGSAGIELRVIGDSVITGSLIVSGANGAGVFSQGATLVDYLAGISNSGSYVAWRAPFSCSVVAMYGYKEGGGNAEVNAAKVSGGTTSRHKNTNITVSSDSTWTGDSTIANANYAPGDYLKLIMSGSGNNQLAVQVDFIRRA